MTIDQASPPRLAQLLLHVALPARDADPVLGDLLEEYRAVRRPSRGRLGADAWYVKQVLSVAGRPIWPFAVALLIGRLTLAALKLFPLSGWNPSLLPAPNLSLLDGVLFLAAGYYGAYRTGRLATGIVNAGVLAAVDFAMFAMVATIMFPTLPAVVWQKPFIIVIGATFLMMALTFAVALGAIGAVAGRRNSRPPDTCVEHAFEQSSGGHR
jgi:hypothetical protein